MVSKRYVVVDSLKNANPLSALLSPAVEAGSSLAQETLKNTIQYWKGVGMIPVKALNLYQKCMLL
jgi:hypothetical protein